MLVTQWQICCVQLLNEALTFIHPHFVMEMEKSWKD
jgi:hypothetical protein